jgi:hypothetical protein
MIMFDRSDASWATGSLSDTGPIPLPDGQAVPPRPKDMPTALLSAGCEAESNDPPESPQSGLQTRKPTPVHHGCGSAQPSRRERCPWPSGGNPRRPKAGRGSERIERLAGIGFSSASRQGLRVTRLDLPSKEFA